MSVEKLLELASPALCANSPVDGDRLDIAIDLLALLGRRNGFYAFESALHVFPVCAERADDLRTWNHDGLWRNAYGDMAENLLFFAEDIFGGQFTFTGSDVAYFNPETASLELIADSVEGWASRILTDFNVLTGYPLAHEWQQLHGPIAEGERLVPRVPFVAGGEFSLENLVAVNSVEAMRYRGFLATQIRDLPEGATIQLEFD